MDWSSLFNETALQNLAILPTLINLVLVLILGQILSWHYLHFSRVLTNKRKFARIFVTLSATTMLVISVVKTSLALSLGLVGALSIIRFRTPVKEPEDLAYLFLALAMGIGLGADQRLATCILFFGILIAGALLQRFTGEPGSLPRVYAHVTTKLERDGNAISTEEGLRLLLDRATQDNVTADLRRVDTRDNTLDATLILDLTQTQDIGAVISRIQEVFPTASVSVVEGLSLD